MFDGPLMVTPEIDRLFAKAYDDCTTDEQIIAVNRRVREACYMLVRYALGGEGTNLQFVKGQLWLDPHIDKELESTFRDYENRGQVEEFNSAILDACRDYVRYVMGRYQPRFPIVSYGPAREALKLLYNRLDQAAAHS